MKKTMIRIGILLLVILLLVLICGAWFVRSLLYPKVLVTGTGAAKVMCVGDSITFSQGVLKTRKTDSYPAVLANLLGEDYQTLNYGLPNRTLQSTGNMPYFKEKLAQKSYTEAPQIVIFMLGTNDTKPANWNTERFAREYREALESYQKMAGNPKVYAMIPPQIFLETPDEGDCSSAILEEHLLTMIPEIAGQLEIPVIDLYTLTKDHPEWFADGLHPNVEGNRAIAAYICSMITES